MNRTPHILYYAGRGQSRDALYRIVALAEAVARLRPDACQRLLAPGHVERQPTWPRQLNTMRLPAPVGDRAAMIGRRAARFQPDIVLVDGPPTGNDDELLPAMRAWRRADARPRLVWGLPDVADLPEKTRREWRRTGVAESVRDYYVHILHYGEQALFDPFSVYGLTSLPATRVTECGYLSRFVGDVRPASPAERPLIVVDGRGPDAQAIARTFQAMLADWPAPPFHTVFTTPADHTRHLAAAAMVVGRADYATVGDGLAAGCRLLLIPEMKARGTQYLRAQALAQSGAARLLLPYWLDVITLRRAVEEMLSQDRPPRRLRNEGTATAVRALLPLLAAAPGQQGLSRDVVAVAPPVWRRNQIAFAHASE